MITARGSHTATPLSDGRVFVLGGWDGSGFLGEAEVWDPKTDAFSPAGQLDPPRFGYTATELLDGRVLIAGGETDRGMRAKVKLWDPQGTGFDPAGKLATRRSHHTSTLLPDGRVLVIGGATDLGDGGPLASAEIWDPATESFSPAGTLAAGRLKHTSTLLPDGRVLVVGGLGPAEPGRPPRAEIWDPASMTFSETGPPLEDRGEYHTATLLTDGRVLIVGGDGGDHWLASAEIWDPLAEPPTPWPSTTLPGARDVTAGHDRFVAVGGRGGRKPLAKVWTSPDGLEWTRAPKRPDLEGATMYHVISTDDGFVAMGTDARGRVVAWHSPDGLTWERGSIKRPAEVGLRSVIDGPGGLLALGVVGAQDYGGHRMWRSTDGRRWKPVRVPKVEFVDVLVAIPGGYWLIGHDEFGSKNAFWRSSDGISWKRLKGAPWLRDAAVSDDGTVAGIGISDIWASDDFLAWEQVWQDSQQSEGDPELHWIDWDGARFVTTGNVGYEYLECLDGAGGCPQEPWLVSEDGHTWVESTGPDGLPGPDRETYLAGTATLGDRTVALGFAPQGRATAWLMSAPTPAAAPTHAGNAEARLLAGVDPQFRPTCRSSRSHMPEAAVAGVDCWPGVGPFRLRYFLFEQPSDLLEAYKARLDDTEPEGGATGPGSCEADLVTEGPYQRDAAGDLAGSPYRGGCYVDEAGNGHYLVTSPPLVLSEFIARRPGDYPTFATAAEWRWTSNDDSADQG